MPEKLVRRVEIKLTYSTDFSNLIYAYTWTLCPQGCGTEVRFSRLLLGVVNGYTPFFPRFDNPLDIDMNKDHRHPVAVCNSCLKLSKMTPEVAAEARYLVPSLVDEKLVDMWVAERRSKSALN